MIDRNIPRDITKYEAKLMLGLTTRQVCFFAPGVILGIITFFVTKAFLGNLALALAILVAAPLIIFGTVKPLGLPMEKFISTTMLPLLMAPKYRRYKIENTYEKAFKDITNDDLKSIGIEPQEETPDVQNTDKKNSKKKSSGSSGKKYVSKNPANQVV